MKHKKDKKKMMKLPFFLKGKLQKIRINTMSN